MDKDERPSILIVDDLATNLLVLEHCLSVLDVNIIKASSGNEALALTLEHDFALILLDVQMPDMDGYETAQLIRSKEAKKYIPIIFLTAISKDPKQVSLGYDVGAVDYLFKPFDPDVLMNKANVFLKLYKQKKELQELNQLKNKFLGIAAHDLRNPLISIEGFSEVLLDESMGAMNEEQKEILGRINYISQSMLSLLNDLLDISIIESGKIDLHYEKISLKDLIEKRVQVHEILGRKKKISLFADLPDIPLISFDSKRISQVIDNLINNAIKFSPIGSEIHISMSREEKEIMISVRDEGPGISSEDQSRLFGEFQKLSAQPTGGEESTGLGLSIVKKNVEAHKGVVSVTSQVGQGATFSFTLPAE